MLCCSVPHTITTEQVLELTTTTTTTTIITNNNKNNNNVENIVMASRGQLKRARGRIFGFKLKYHLRGETTDITYSVHKVVKG